MGTWTVLRQLTIWVTSILCGSQARSDGGSSPQIFLCPHKLCCAQENLFWTYKKNKNLASLKCILLQQILKPSYRLVVATYHFSKTVSTVAGCCDVICHNDKLQVLLWSLRQTRYEWYKKKVAQTKLPEWILQAAIINYMGKTNYTWKTYSLNTCVRSF